MLLSNPSSNRHKTCCNTFSSGGDDSTHPYVPRVLPRLTSLLTEPSFLIDLWSFVADEMPLVLRLFHQNEFCLGHPLVCVTRCDLDRSSGQWLHSSPLPRSPFTSLAKCKSSVFVVRLINLFFTLKTHAPSAETYAKDPKNPYAAQIAREAESHH